MGDAELVGGSITPLVMGSTVEAVVDSTKGCWRSAVGSSSYVAFRLPDITTPLIIKVRSEPVGGTLLVPRLVVLNARGEALRDVPRDAFLFHGSALAVAIRLQSDDRYLVVASDPAAVRQQVSYTSGGNLIVPITPLHFANIGRETTATYTLAHNGKVRVTLEALPTISR